MKVAMISGIRNARGPAREACDALMEGVRASGGDGPRVLLPALHLERCRHCEQGARPCVLRGRCAVEDDFPAVVRAIRDSDASVFSTAVYPAGPSPAMRAFLHRLGQICRHGPTRESFRGTPAAVICVGGGARHCAAKLADVLNGCGFDVREVLTAGRQAPHLKRDELRAAGRRLVADLPRDTRAGADGGAGPERRAAG